MTARWDSLGEVVPAQAQQTSRPGERRSYATRHPQKLLSFRT